MKLDPTIGAGRNLDRGLVPPELQDIVCIVEKWAFQRLEHQDAFIKLMGAVNPGELDAFNRIIDSKRSAIWEWGCGLCEIHPATAPQHPYWAFLSVLKLREASGPTTDAETIQEINAVKERLAKEFRDEQFKATTQAADAAFRKGHFSEYVAMLSPFEDLLSTTQHTKLRLASNRSNPGTTQD